MNTPYKVGDEVIVDTHWLRVDAQLSDDDNLHGTYRCGSVFEPGKNLVLKQLDQYGRSSHAYQQFAQDAFRHFAQHRQKFLGVGLPDVHFCDWKHFLMDFVSGEKLEDHLPPPEVPDRVRYIRDLLLGVIEPMDVIREAGLVHRDIKTPNIMLRHGMQPTDKRAITLIDLDTLSVVSDEPIFDRLPFGTISHMAKEIFSRSAHGFPADVYALGVTGIELLEMYLPGLFIFNNGYTADCSLGYEYARARQFNSWLMRSRWPKLTEEILRNQYAPDPRSVRQVLGLIYECLHDEASDRPKDGATMRQILMDTGNITEI